MMETYANEAGVCVQKLSSTTFSQAHRTSLPLRPPNPFRSDHVNDNAIRHENSVLCVLRRLLFEAAWQATDTINFRGIHISGKFNYFCAGKQNTDGWCVRKCEELRKLIGFRLLKSFLGARRCAIEKGSPGLSSAFCSLD